MLGKRSPPGAFRILAGRQKFLKRTRPYFDVPPFLMRDRFSGVKKALRDIAIPVSAAIRVTVRFLRRHEDGRGQAPSFGGVAETFVARNRGPRVQAMDI